MVKEQKMEDVIHPERIRDILNEHKTKMKLSLKICAHCSLCAESCFLFMTKEKKPEYMPSHKIIHSIGKLYKKKGRVDTSELERIRVIVWEKCVLCQRCYCPFGINIPEMIVLARRVCRSQNILHDFHKG